MLTQQRASADPITLARISVSPLAAETDGPSGAPLISADGSTVVFQSAADNLVAGDTNGDDDVFAAPATGGPPQLISQAPDGEPADGSSTPLAISADGRFVVFASTADNLGAVVPRGVVEIYVFDRETGGTDLVSKATTGAPGNRSSGGAAISADGRYIAFASAASNLVSSDTNGAVDVFVRDRLHGTTGRVDVGARGVQANGAADPQVVSMSADGSVIAFSSAATNLVRRDINGQWDVFVRYRPRGLTSRISTPQPGVSGTGRSLFPSVSANGNMVAFESLAPLIAGRHRGLMGHLHPQPRHRWADARAGSLSWAAADLRQRHHGRVPDRGGAAGSHAVGRRRDLEPAHLRGRPGHGRRGRRLLDRSRDGVLDGWQRRRGRVRDGWIRPASRRCQRDAGRVRPPVAQWVGRPAQHVVRRANSLLTQDHLHTVR